jgi:1-deoxy-D-xylulose-5-phosphate synthase
VNPRFAKPVDYDCIDRYAAKCGLVVTMEDHVLAGGFGSAVLECLNEQEIDVPVVRIGWPDQFIEHGSIAVLQQKHGLTPEAAVEKVLPFVKQKLAAGQPKSAA